MLEVSLAAVLLAGVLSVCLQMLGAVGTQHRSAEARRTAAREAGNVLERLKEVAWDDLATEVLAGVQLCEEASQALPGAKLSIEVSTAADDPDAKRLAVQIRWQDRSGRFVRPVQVVAWRYRPPDPEREDRR